MIVRADLGTDYVGCDSNPVFFDIADQKEFDSDAFSTEILNAIFNGDFSHMFLDLTILEPDNLDEDEIEEIEDYLGYNPFDEDDDEEDDDE